MKTRVINIDWLEISVLENQKMDAEYFKKQGYKVDVREYGTPQYREMFTIYENKKPFLEVRRNPYSLKKNGGIFDERSVHLRLCNNTLYEKTPITRLRAFLVAHNYTYQHLSRIDICLDFTSFDDDCEFDIPSFCNSYMSGKISKVNQPVMAAHGNDRWDGRLFNSFKWGSQSSPNTTKMYNKSLELRKSTDKTYIKDAWLQAGLDITKDVWRIEFSMTSQFQTLLNKKTGEIMKKELSDYDTRQKCMYQFFLLFNKYFDFRFVEFSSSGKMKRKYDCERIKLFNFSYKDTAFEPIRNPPVDKNPSRTLTILANRIAKMSEEKDMPTYILEAFRIVMDYLYHQMGVFKYNGKKSEYEKIIKTLDDIIYEKGFELKPWVEVKSTMEMKLKQQEIERKERNYMMFLIKKYGIITAPDGCPF